MIPVSIFAEQRVALFGLGGSGLVTAHALLAGGAEVIAYDDNPSSVEEANNAGIPTSDLRDIDWTQLSALVLAPGVPLTHPKPHWTVERAKSANVPIVGDIELFFKQMALQGRRAPVVAITGTNGKSTTTALIAHVLKTAGRDVQMGGNIGRAALDLDPLGDTPALQVYVIECSSYQIDLAPSINPHIGILLNLAPDHLERHGHMENYASIKSRLVENSDVAIVSVDDPHCLAIANKLKPLKSALFTLASHGRKDIDYSYSAGSVWNGDGKKVSNFEDVGSLRGQHNAQNVAAAYATCDSLGVSHEDIQRGITSFPGLAHRMEQVGSVDNVLFVNDSKATNVDAAATALSSFEKVFWIVGGLAKEGGIASLSTWFPHVEKAYLIGESASSFAAQLGDTIPYEISGTLIQAVNHALLDARKLEGQQVVILSPAAASFDQFPNFEKRGDAFKAAVKALSGYSQI